MSRTLMGPLVVVAALLGTAAGAQVQPAAPVAGTTPAATTAAATTAPSAPPKSDQQRLDEAECQNMATQATGYVMGTPAPTATSPKGPSGQRAAGAAKGAAAGAVVGEVQGNNYARAPQAVQDEYRGNQAGAGAVVGTVAGGSQVRQDRRATNKEQQKAQQEAQAKAQSWDSQYRGCMTQRGYTFQ